MNNLLKTKLATAFLCLIGFVQVESHSLVQSKITSFGGGHIETLGDMLTAETNNPIVVIDFLRITNNSHSYSYEGCKSERCSFDISNVATGTYEAIVSTSDGHIFSETIFVKN